MGSNRSPELILRLPAALIKKIVKLPFLISFGEIREAHRILGQGWVYPKSTSYFFTVCRVWRTPRTHSSDFVRSGRLYLPNTRPLNNAGQYGVYWSSFAYSNSNNAYYLYFNSSGVNPSNYYDRFYGFSLRCLAVVCPRFGADLLPVLTF